MGALERLRRYLDQERIAYEVREHPVAYTAQEIAALEHVAGRRMAKVVGPNVRLAHEEEFTPAFPDCDAGAMPPFGNLYSLPVYVDSALAEDETIVSQAGTHRHTMEIAYADFERLVQPVVASLSDPVR